MLGSAESELPSVTITSRTDREIIFEYFQRLCDHDTQCYGETERQRFVVKYRSMLRSAR